jgi:hypothetical protein
MPERPRTAVENPRIRLRFGWASHSDSIGRRANGLRTRPGGLASRESRVVGASEMATGVVVGRP